MHTHTATASPIVPPLPKPLFEFEACDAVVEVELWEFVLVAVRELEGVGVY